MKKYHLPALLTVFLLLLLAICQHFPLKQVLQTSRKTAVVVIDVGHGGFDPGKISVDGTPEKDINLAIALRLQKYLAATDCQVYLTRETDCSLSDPDVSNKKQSDMKNRAAFIEQLRPDLMISIHQNSFPSQTEYGAQTFYYHTSDNSSQLAGAIQTSLIETVNPENHRREKSNDSYYMLKNVSCPAVIVECGFLSNPTEAALLNTESYQELIAYAIARGVRVFLNTADTNGTVSARHRQSVCLTCCF